MDLGRNDPCWCGSGKKFKKCHIDREREAPRPLPAIASTLTSFFRFKQCLHPQASKSTCGKVISAHTIQRQGALTHIADETNHCLTFYPPTGHPQLRPQRRGIREASTFSGFCGKHDSSTFAPLETVPFQGTAEQCFLLAYRAECHELYQKTGSMRSHESLRQVVDRGMSIADQYVVQGMQEALGAGVQLGLEDSRFWKAVMDRQLLERSYDGYCHVFVRFKGALTVAATGVPTPERSVSGTRLQDLGEATSRVQRLYVSVVPAAGGGAVVLTWRKGEPAPEGFVGDLVVLPRLQLASKIVQFLFAHIENTYFSAAWWDGLSVGEKDHVRSLAIMGDPYRTRWKYKNLSVPWAVTNVGESWLLVGDASA